MKLSELDPLMPLSKLKQEFLKLPKDYFFDEEATVEFLSRRRWPESERRIDRTTFWRWRNDTGVRRQKLFNGVDILKLCQICDHYRVDGTRDEYLKVLRRI